MIPYFIFDQINIGPLRFYTWGLFVGLAFSAGYFLLLYQAKSRQIETVKIIGLALSVFVGAVIGSRLLFLLQNPASFFKNINLLWQISGGLMMYGGILGGILAGWLFVKKAKLDLWRTADLIAPALALGIGIGRIGCFLVNDHQGSPTNLPWGILWPGGIARHPVALYESLAAFALFIIFWFLRNKIKQPGRLFLLFLVSYSVIRFLLDFLRESHGFLADPRWRGFTSSQWISLSISVVSLIIFIRMVRLSKDLKQPA